MFCKYCKRKIEPVLVKHSLPFRPHKEKSLTTRFWKVIIRSSAFSVSFSCPLTEAKHIGILSLSCPSTEVTGSVKITAKNTSCEQNIYISAQNVIVCVCVSLCACVWTHRDMLLQWWRCCPKLNHKKKISLSEPQRRSVEMQRKYHPTQKKLEIYIHNIHSNIKKEFFFNKALISI